MSLDSVKGKGRFLLLAVIDFLLIYLSYFLGMYFRYGIFSLDEPEFFLNGVFFSIFISLSLIFNGAYTVSWSYANFRDFWIVLRGVLLGYGAGFAFGRIMVTLDVKIFTVPFTVATMTFVGATFLIIWSRIFWLSYRWVSSEKYSGKREKILIVGAGDGGVSLADEISRNPSFGRVFAFVDDSPRKLNKKIRGVPVMGTIESTMDLVKKYDIDKVIVAIPSATSGQIKRVMSLVDLQKVNVQTLPGITEMMNGKAKLGYLREINIDDLLGRDTVGANVEDLEEYITGRAVMVTGAGGSIGSELCRQISILKPSLLLLLGRGENSIYQIQQELGAKFPDLPTKRLIGDVQDQNRMEHIFKRFRPEIVFHAAAHKHVPLMEENPTEAFRVNSLGTLVLATEAERNGCKVFIIISTDKAVNPTSIMGVSKRLAEEFIRCVASKSETRFGIVRFGNVLGSRGSVVPKFEKQIRAGGPVTVTDPRMTRYFMTIPEAVSLVMQAGAFANRGEVFVLDMGKPVKITDLAREMITLAGYVPGQEIDIEYTGIRPGEKLFEELSLNSEHFDGTAHPKIFKLKMDSCLSPEECLKLKAKLEETVAKSDFRVMREIIGEYVPDGTAIVNEDLPEKNR